MNNQLVKKQAISKVTHKIRNPHKETGTVSGEKQMPGM